jgi:hypothetical protein
MDDSSQIKPPSVPQQPGQPSSQPHGGNPGSGQGQSVQQQAQTPLQPSAVPQQPIAPVAPGHKEAEPVVQPSVEIPAPEVIPAHHEQPESMSGEAGGEHLVSSEQEPQLAPEVEKAGVEVQKGIPQLTLADQKAGVMPAAAVTPVPTAPVNQIQLPMTPKQAQQTLKTHTSTSDPLRWLAALILKQWKKQQPFT